jgi:hypothetical protein
MMILKVILIVMLGMNLVVRVKGSPSNVRVTGQSSSVGGIGRIDCYPEAEAAAYSNYSKASCLARNCLFDDAAANLSDIPCYLRPNYGYILQGNEVEIPNGKRLYLKRNAAVNSSFPEPIENVILDVFYYTNDIIRIKLYDADNNRYEVKFKTTD